MSRVVARSDYGTDALKRAVRQSTVVDMYRAVTGLHAIPTDRTYWGLCGPLYVKGTLDLQENCELRHFLREGLLTASQYNGIEFDVSHCALNRLAVRRSFASPRPRILYGPMDRVIARACRRGDFTPALVNIDTQWEPRRAAALLGRVAEACNHVDVTSSPVVLVWNIILKNPRKAEEHSTQNVVDAVLGDSLCNQALRRGWSQSPILFRYERPLTTMGTIVFRRGGV